MSPEAVEEGLEVTVPASPQIPRPYFSKKMTGFNSKIYSTWIERWARNSAMNYPIISRARGVEMLRSSGVNVPCVVVGIGPSLDDNIEALKRSKQVAVIISTDAALRPLVRHGIKPDLVINYDARDDQKTMWETMDTSEFVLLANSVSSPQTIEAWKGSLMFFNMMQSDDEFATNILPAIYPHIGQLPSMGTVGNGAVFLAWQMGCSPIMLVGMDLCYKQVENPPHIGDCEGYMCSWKYRAKDWNFIGAGNAPGIPDFWSETENKTLYDNDERLKDTQDETIKGKIYKTDKALEFYRNALVRNIGKFDMPVINCSPGVLENQVKTMTLEKAIENRIPLSDGQTVLKHLAKIIPNPKKENSNGSHS